MLCSNARGAIALLDGAGPGGIYSTNTVANTSTITNCFTVSQGASVMVAELWDQNGQGSTLLAPSFITWSNATLGTTQILTQAVITNANAGGYIDTALYYLWNPLPGTGVVSATDTNSTAPSHMFMQVFDLSGVDTTANGTVPFSAASANSSATTLSVNTPNDLSGAWAAVMNQNYNGGGGNTTTNTASSGTAVGFNWFPAGQLQMCSGYISGMASGVSTITATGSGGATHMDIVAMVFEPAIGTGIYLHDGSIFNYYTFSNSPVVIGNTITNMLTITPGASVLVAELWDAPNYNSANTSPQYLIWSNITLGTTQIVNLAISGAAGYNLDWQNLYYLWDPSPGTGVIIGTDTNSSPVNALAMDSYTLAGVDTTANGTVPYSTATATGVPPNLPPDSTTLSVLTSAGTLAGSWAAAISVNYNGGNGNKITNVCSSGGPYCYNFQPGSPGVVQMCMGYMTNLAGGVSTITANATGGATHMGLSAMVLSPLPGTATPVNVTATGQNGDILVSWQDASRGAAASFQIYRSTTQTGTYTQVGSVNAPTTNFTDTTEINWNTYWYEVTATGPGGVSLFSAPPVSAAASGTPGTITSLTATNGVNSVVLNWNDLGATNFVIWRSTSSGSEVKTYSLTANSVNAPAFSYTDTSVTAATKYFYEVQPTNYYGNGAISPEVSAIPCVAFFTNWIIIAVDNTCTNGWIPNSPVATPLFAEIGTTPSLPPPSSGFMDMEISLTNTTYTTNNSIITTNEGTFAGAIVSNLPNYNLSTYVGLQFDLVNLSGQFDEYGQVQAIQLMLTCSGTTNAPTGYKFMNTTGPNSDADGDIVLYSQTDDNQALLHFKIPMSQLAINVYNPPATYNAVPTNCTALQLGIYDGDLNGQTTFDIGFANMQFYGAPGYTPVFTVPANPTVAPGAPSVTLTGKVSAVVGGQNTYLNLGTPVNATIAGGGSTQTTTVYDSTGDFSIVYTLPALGNGNYQITYTTPSDNVSFVPGTNNSTSLTVTTISPVGPPNIPAPKLNAAGTALLVTPGGDTSSGHMYYLLQTTNLSPPVVWTTNTSFMGTGAPVTNSVPLNTAKDIYLKYQVN
ncbi:MAG: hypothetical protein ABSE16_00755 [Verrucomicrobiota bacterium]